MARGCRASTSAAKPMLQVFFPELAHLGQPLGGVIARIREAQRQAADDIEQVPARRRGRRRVLLLDRDVSVLRQPFAQALAAATGKTDALATLLATFLTAAPDSPARRERIAALFRFMYRRQFEAAAQAVPIRAGAIEWVNRLRRAGFMVGVVSDGWFVAADIVRRRVFADLALAHQLQFDSEVCTGELRVNPAFVPPGHASGRRVAAASHGPGPQGAVPRLRDDPAEPLADTVWAAGHIDSNTALLKSADLSFVTGVADTGLPPRGTVAFERFDELLDRVPEIAAEPVSECVRT